MRRVFGEDVRRAALLIAALALLSAGCSRPASPSARTTPTPVPTGGRETNIVVVHATDYALTPESDTVPAGRVRVILVNDSKGTAHSLFLYPKDQARLDAMLEQLRAGARVDERQYLQGLEGSVVNVPAGQQLSFFATLTPGAYELACFAVSTVDGKPRVHYDLGMHTTLTVGPG